MCVVCLGLCHRVALPYRGCLSSFSFILERKTENRGIVAVCLTHSVSFLRWWGDKVIPMNAHLIWGRGPLIWHDEVCCQITQNLRGPCKSSRGVLCKPGTTNLLVCARGHLVMDTLSRGDWRAAIQQQAAYLERLVLSAPLLEDKSFKDTHYLAIVGPSPL